MTGFVLLQYVAIKSCQGYANQGAALQALQVFRSVHNSLEQASKASGPRQKAATKSLRAILWLCQSCMHTCRSSVCISRNKAVVDTAREPNRQHHNVCELKRQPHTCTTIMSCIFWHIKNPTGTQKPQNRVAVLEGLLASGRCATLAPNLLSTKVGWSASPDECIECSHLAWGAVK